MKPRLVWETSRVLLPLVGDSVVSLIFATGFPDIVLRNVDETESLISVQPSAVFLGEFGKEQQLEFLGKPDDFAPVLPIVGTCVTEAIAYRKGSLWIEFDRRFTLRIDHDQLIKGHFWPTENWKLQYPRPGKLLRNSNGALFSVEGSDNGLLVFDAG